MTRVGLIAAMPGELKPLVKGWQHERREAPNSRPVDLWHSRQGDTELVGMFGTRPAGCDPRLC